MENDNLYYEKCLSEAGCTFIAGMDEVGRGPLAGPVVSACVLFRLPITPIIGVKDSKKLSAKKREELYDIILSSCISYGIGIVEHAIIDEVNILEATKLSMHMAIDNLSTKPEHILIDAVRLNIGIPSTSLIKGDDKSFVISASSIIAKVYRDRLMCGLHNEYPEYNWRQNKGYGTREHVEAIRRHGFSPYHRKSFNVNL